MAKATNQMRIRYNEERDAFRIEITTDGKEWDFCTESKCIKGEDGRGNYISLSFLTTLRKNLAFGYKLVE